MTDYMAEQLAEMRAEIAALKNERVTQRVATVVTTDPRPGISTFTASLPDGQQVAGLSAPPQFMPAPGDEVKLTLQGGTPRYEPARIGARTIGPDLLASEMVLTSQIVVVADQQVGQEGDHLLIAPNAGLRSYVRNPDGLITSTSQFGGVGADRIIVTNPDTGANVAALNDKGFLSVTGAAVSGPLYVRGNSIDYMLDQLPKGEIARAGVEANLPETTTALGAYDVEFTAYPGRSYKISTTPINVYPTTTATYVYAALTVRPSADGPPSLANGKPIVAARNTAAIAGGAAPITLTKNVSFNELFANNTPPAGQIATKVRVLLVYGVVSGGGAAGVFSTSSYPVHTVIEDAGTTKPFTGVVNNGSGTTGAPVTETTADYSAAWSRSYNGPNTAERSTTDLVQGYTPDMPASGSAISLIGFPDVTGALAGATINWAALYIEATHWYFDTGGEIMLGTHNHPADTGTVKPGTGLTADQVRQNFSGKSGGIWIYLPDTMFAGLKSGAVRGFMLGNQATGSSLHYGRFVKAGTLRINYTK